MVACSGWAGIGPVSGTVAEFTNTETLLVVVPSEWTSLTTAELWNPVGHPTVVDQVGDVDVGLAVLPPGVRTSVPGDVPMAALAAPAVSTAVPEMAAPARASMAAVRASRPARSDFSFGQFILYLSLRVHLPLPVRGGRAGSRPAAGRPEEGRCPRVCPDIPGPGRRQARLNAPSDRVGGRVEGAQGAGGRAARVGRGRPEQREAEALDRENVLAEVRVGAGYQLGQVRVEPGHPGRHLVEQHDVEDLAGDREAGVDGGAGARAVAR